MVQALLIALTLLYSSLAAGAAETRVAADLELVLAVDASGSVDENEFKLQLSGIAAAFRDEEVQNAIISGPRARIAVLVEVWADSSTQKDETEWFILANAADCKRFANLVEHLPRRVEGGTGIGSAIARAVRLMQYNAIDAPRQVVDVSGDGIETPIREDVGILLPQARAMADSLHVVVNGLAITNEVQDLDIYYRDDVITGPGSFVMKAADYVDFREAVRAKLIREIAASVSLLMR